MGKLFTATKEATKEKTFNGGKTPPDFPPSFHYRLGQLAGESSLGAWNGPEVPLSGGVNEGGIVWIKLSSLVPSPQWSRRYYDPEKVERLAKSIARNGLVLPLVARQDGNRYLLLDGHYRYRLWNALRGSWGRNSLFPFSF